MKAIRHLAILLTLAVSAIGVRAGEPDTRTDTVSKVKDGKIYTESDKVFQPDAGTKIVKATANGEVGAKLADIKPGDTIEVQTEKGAAGIKKIVIQTKGT
jgi:hypothetical protein